MAEKILVSGLINIETTLQVDRFPIDYFPVRFPFFGINSSVSGVGYNVAKALTVLGNQVNLISIIGDDFAGCLARQTLAGLGLDRFLLAAMHDTAQSIILYDPHGQRQIHTDLKDIQQQQYPEELYRRAVRDCSLVVLCNVNFSRPLLPQARAAGKTIATDVHTIESLDDPYNKEFMDQADILFMSDENLPCSAEEWAQRVHERFNPQIVVVGLGAHGALLSLRGHTQSVHVPAVETRPIVNTIGAGDALFASFLHSYLRCQDPYLALHEAVVFASFKIGVAGAADGFLDHVSLVQLTEDLYRRMP